MDPKPLLLPALLLIGACGTNISRQLEHIDEVEERLQSLRADHAPRAATAHTPGTVDIPRDQAWLHRPLDPGNFTALTLREAMDELLPGQPVSYLIDDRYDPRVQTSPDAVTVRDHLDSIALQANIGWTYRAGTIVFTHTVTRQYAIPLYGGGVTTTSVHANNLGDQQGPNRIVNSINATIHLHSEVRHLIGTTLNIIECPLGEGISNPDGSGEPPQPENDRETLRGLPLLAVPVRTLECYNISGSANLITITARPQTLIRFDSAYRAFIESLNRKANLKIITLKLDVTDLSQQRLDLDILRRGTDLSGSLSNVASDFTGSQSSGTADTLGAVLNLTLTRPGSPFAGSQLLLQQLESIANLSIEDSREVIAYSNRLITVQDTDRYTYIREIRRDPETTGNTTTLRTSVTADQIVTGQALNILPSLTRDSISLHIVINESTLTRLRIDGTEDTRITLPDTANSDVVFDVTLQDRETALIASSIRAETHTREDKSGLMPIRLLDRLLSNANEGRQRIYQTLYLIEASFRERP